MYFENLHHSYYINYGQGLPEKYWENVVKYSKNTLSSRSGKVLINSGFFFWNVCDKIYIKNSKAVFGEGYMKSSFGRN